MTSRTSRFDVILMATNTVRRIASEILGVGESKVRFKADSIKKIEEALTILKALYTIVLVTNNTKQAARVADETAFFLMGELIEKGPTARIFTTPKDRRTEDYVTGRFG